MPVNQTKRIVDLSLLQIQSWQRYRNGWCAELIELGASLDSVNHVLDSIEPIYLETCRPLELPVGAMDDETLIKVQSWVNNIFNGLMQKIIVREFWLYQNPEWRSRQ